MPSWAYTDFESFQAALMTTYTTPPTGLITEWDAYKVWMGQTGRVAGGRADFDAFMAATTISGTIQPTTQQTQTIFMVAGGALLLLMLMR